MRNESAPGVKTQNESKTVVVTWLARTSCNWRYHFSRHPANPLSSTVTPVLLRIEGLSPRKARVRVGRRRNLAGKKKLRGELSILTRNGVGRIGTLAVKHQLSATCSWWSMAAHDLAWTR